jgi:hypothetical protein
MRRAAEELDLAHAALCIEEKKVRIANVSHPVFGPAPPEFERSDFLRLLPPGKLRDLLAEPPRDK